MEKELKKRVQELLNNTPIHFPCQGFFMADILSKLKTSPIYIVFSNLFVLTGTKKMTLKTRIPVYLGNNCRLFVFAGAVSRSFD